MCHVKKKNSKIISPERPRGNLSPGLTVVLDGPAPWGFYPYTWSAQLLPGEKLGKSFIKGVDQNYLPHFSLGNEKGKREHKGKRK